LRRKELFYLSLAPLNLPLEGLANSAATHYRKGRSWPTRAPISN
jgi:hypothetical protein